MSENRTGIVFDFGSMTTYQMGKFQNALKGQDYEAICNGLAVVVTECPYGEPNNPDTYGDLPFMTTFQDVILDLNDALRDEGKKLKKR